MELKTGIEPVTCRLRIPAINRVGSVHKAIYGQVRRALWRRLLFLLRGGTVRAEDRDRTGDLPITNRLLYQLSYFSKTCSTDGAAAPPTTLLQQKLSAASIRPSERILIERTHQFFGRWLNRNGIAQQNFF